MTRLALAITLALFAACALIGAACAEVPPPGVAYDAADVSEQNAFYDECGKLIFIQHVWWLWSNDFARHECLAWRMARHHSQRPARDWRNGGYVAVWYDGDLLRVTRTGGFRESWTQVDVEVIDRQVLPKEQRRELSNPKRVKVDVFDFAYGLRMQ